MYENDRNTAGTSTHAQQGAHYHAVAALGRVAEMHALIIHRLITPQPSVLPELLQMLPTLFAAFGATPKSEAATECAGSDGVAKPASVAAAA